MSKQTLKHAKTVESIAVAEVVRTGSQITIPEGITIDAAIETLVLRREYEQEEVVLQCKLPVLPFDGAHALKSVLEEIYGWAQSVSTPGFFGDTPPQMIDVQVGPNEFVAVPWGRFTLADAPGASINCGVTFEKGRYQFRIVASTIRAYERVIENVFTKVRAFVKENSIYRGKAIKILFTDNDGDPMEMPEIEFLDTSKVTEDMAIYSRSIEEQIKTNLYTPIRRVADCIANGIPVKRGVLLAGTFGTGKTLAATVASKLAVDNGVTYMYLPKTSDLAIGIDFAKEYQSPACVIFAEDVDRSVRGDRSEAMDSILNILDGIDTKHANIITVVTTNEIETINPAMIRPGRLDAVIDVTAPDAEAAERLVRFYAGNQLPADADLTEVGKLLNGYIPASIQEVVKRAKLSQLSLQEPGTPITGLTAEALENASRSMDAHHKLLERLSAPKETPPTLQTVMVDTIRNEVEGALEGVKSSLDDIQERVS